MSDTHGAFAAQSSSQPGGEAAVQAGPSITFQASRLKLLPAPILLSVLVFFSVALLHQVLQIRAHLHDPAKAYPAIAFMLLLVLAGIWIEILTLLTILFPERIVIDTSGWTQIELGRVKRYAWSDFLEAKEAQVPSGRTSKPGIVLVSKHGAKPVNIMAGIYRHSLYDMLRTMQQAQGGRLVDPGGETFPWFHVLFAIPLSLLGAVSIVLCIGPRLGMGFPA